MPGCVLRVSGDEFDPESFLRTSHLCAYRLWHRGEPRGKTRRLATDLHKDGGFCCLASEVDSDLPAQLAEAQRFLAQNRAEFEHIAATPSVRVCQLDFGIYCVVGKTNEKGRVLVMQGLHLPAAFVQLAGECRVSIAISIYDNRPWTDDTDDGGVVFPSPGIPGEVKRSAGEG